MEIGKNETAVVETGYASHVADVASFSSAVPVTTTAPVPAEPTEKIRLLEDQSKRRVRTYVQQVYGTAYVDGLSLNLETPTERFSRAEESKGFGHIDRRYVRRELFDAQVCATDA